MAMSKTGRHDFPINFLFVAVWISIFLPRGRPGNILLGVKSESMDVLAYSFGEFHIQVSYL
jgi:hypothetical protein